MCAVCPIVGVRALCPIMCVCVSSCVCVCHHEECHPRGGSPYKCSQYNISRSPRRDSTRIWIRLQIRNKVSTRILLGISVACFPKEPTSPFVPLARVFCPYLTIAAAWKRFPRARNKSDSVSRSRWCWRKEGGLSFLNFHGEGNQRFLKHASTKMPLCREGIHVYQSIFETYAWEILNDP